MSLRSRLRRLPVDRFLVLILGAVALASLLPVRGAAADAFGNVAFAAIALLFLSYGARLSPQAVWRGLLHWRLQGLVLLSTYALFPLVGLGASALAATVLPADLALGVLFLTLLPSTVQASIAFTSIAGGNVPAALTSASVSNLLGVVATPLLVLWLAQGEGTAFSFDAVRAVAIQILLPFLVGQILRPLIGAWLARHARTIAAVDRGAILLVVYGAFSQGVVAGAWTDLGWRDLAVVLALDAAMLAVMLASTTLLARRLRFGRADEIAIVFCGSKKSLVTGIPMANILFAGHVVALVVLPLMVFHQIQLFACAVIAQRYARATRPAAQVPAVPEVLEREEDASERAG